MTVKELIEFLQTQPHDIQVTYERYSESCVLEASDIHLVDGCAPRPDGWVHDARPDKPTVPYLRFPGN